MQNGTNSALELRKLPEVCRQTAQSAASVYRGIKQGTFPPPIKIGKRATAWVGASVDQWIRDRIESSVGGAK